MPPHRSWMDDPQYQRREDHPNPAFRPSIDKLSSKLRGLSSLKGHPDAVVFIVDGLIDWFLIREEKRPGHLWKVASRTMDRFRMVMDPGGVGDEQMMEFINERANEAAAAGMPLHFPFDDEPYIEGPMGKKIPLVPEHGFGGNTPHVFTCLCGFGGTLNEFQRHLMAATGEVLMEIPPAPDTDDQYVEAPHYWQGDHGAATGGNVGDNPRHLRPGDTIPHDPDPDICVPGCEVVGVAVGDSPLGEVENQNPESGSLLVLRKDEKERGEASGIDLNDSATKKAIQKIIVDHHWNINRSKCGCGRYYDFIEEWSRHLRTHIWRYLQNEFKPDEG